MQKLERGLNKATMLKEAKFVQIPLNQRGNRGKRTKKWNRRLVKTEVYQVPRA